MHLYSTNLAGFLAPVPFLRILLANPEAVFKHRLAQQRRPGAGKPPVGDGAASFVFAAGVAGLAAGAACLAAGVAGLAAGVAGFAAVVAGLAVASLAALTAGFSLAAESAGVVGFWSQPTKAISDIINKVSFFMRGTLLKAVAWQVKFASVIADVVSQRRVPAGCFCVGTS